jgi:hypothetical protein
VNDYNRQVSFVIWGDSHADTVVYLCDQLAKESGLLGVSATWPGFVPILDAWHVDPTIEGPAKQIEWSREVVNWVVEHEVREIILVARWETRLGAFGIERDGALLRDANTTDVSAGDAERVTVDHFRQTVNELRKADCRVWLLSQVPIQEQSKVTRSIRSVQPPEERPTGVTRSRYNLQQEPFNRVFGQFEGSGVAIVGPSYDWFDQAGRSRIFLGRKRLYHDDNHLSVDGAEVLFKPLLSDVFDSISESSKRPTGN